MDSKGKWNQSKRTVPGTQHEWNDNVTDLSSMRLSKQEQAKKLMSRQSHNLAIAKAELMDRNRHSSSPRSFSPSMSSKLRASGSKTVEEVLADGTAAIALAHKVRNEDMSDQLNKVENYFRSQIHSQEVLESQKNFYEESEQRQKEISSYNMDLHHLQSQQQQQQQQQQQHQHQQQQLRQHKAASAEEQHLAHLTRLGEDEAGIDADGEDDKNQMGIVRRGFIDAEKEEGHSYPLSPQGWQNLNNTIQLVVKTCEALWQQLEEERMTRQRLHFQLQEQRSVITTLTAELLQIQEHQEMILKELHSSRSTSAPYQQPRSFPYNFSAQQQQQQQHQQHQQQQQQRFQSPLKSLPVSRVLADRLPPRTLAFSDSSIDAKQQQNRPFMTADQPYRLSLQGKSKSVTQLDRERDLEEPFHDPHRYGSRPGMDFLHDASVIDLLRNYRLSEG